MLSDDRMGIDERRKYLELVGPRYLGGGHPPPKRSVLTRTWSGATIPAITAGGGCMKALIVYDSVHGNTQKVAQAIGDVIEGEVTVCRVGEATPDDFRALDLLVIGSPTHGGRPTPAIQAFVKGLPGPVSTVRVAVFDTRMPAGWVKVFGFAADRISKTLMGRGWAMDMPPEGFFVQGREGPLKDGEMQRAAAWAKSLSERNR